MGACAVPEKLMVLAEVSTTPMISALLIFAPSRDAERDASAMRLMDFSVLMFGKRQSYHPLSKHHPRQRTKHLSTCLRKEFISIAAHGNSWRQFGEVVVADAGVVEPPTIPSSAANLRPQT